MIQAVTQFGAQNTGRAMRRLGDTMACIGRACLLALGLSTGATMAPAQQAGPLIDAFRIDAMVEIIREEGLRYGRELGTDMLPGTRPDTWERLISRIYDPERLLTVIRTGLEEELEGQDLGVITAFFTSDLGVEIVELELAAREAFLDEDVENAAREAFEAARAAQTPLHETVVELIEDSDLIEFNVMGALNSNFAFYRGLADGDALEMSEEDMLADVWSQESEIRSDSMDWLGAYLMMAYQALPPEDLARYAEMYRSDQGQAVNAAIFASYDRMYEEVSYLLGRAIADQMQSEDL